MVTQFKCAAVFFYLRLFLSLDQINFYRGQRQPDQGEPQPCDQWQVLRQNHGGGDLPCHAQYGLGTDFE